MKKIKSIPVSRGVCGVFLLLMTVVILNSCSKDYTGVAPVDPNVPVSFSEQIIPIFTASCATASTCHKPGGHVPDLTPTHAYDELLGLGYVDSTNAAGSKLYTIINASSNYMPKDGKLSGDKISLIFNWIKQGAQNN